MGVFYNFNRKLFNLSFLLGFGIFGVLFSSSTFAKESILITGFEPFAGRTINRSFEVAQEIKNQIKLFGFDKKIQVKICLLPVIYDKGAQKAIDCYEKLRKKPSLVLSLGEGRCKIDLETAAHNLDSVSSSDNEGQVRTESKIIQNAADSIGLTLPIQQMFCAIEEEYRDRFNLSVSYSTGQFVCNNTAFLLSHYFKNQNTPYGFIHVPPAKCKQLSDPVMNAQIIMQMLVKAIRFNHKKIGKNYPFPHLSNQNQMPTNLDEMKKLYAFYQTNHSISRCEKQFLLDLGSKFIFDIQKKLKIKNTPDFDRSKITFNINR